MPNYYFRSKYHKPRNRLSRIASMVSNWPKQVIRKLRTEKMFRRKLIRGLIYSMAGLLVALTLTVVAVAFSLPDPNKLDFRLVPQSTKIYARDKTTLLYEIHGEAKRTVIDPSDLPAYVKEASIAVEEKDFYNNHGVDWKGIIRAAFIDITSGNIRQGGSTITQQFVRNAILTREKTLLRKIKEIVLAIELEQRYSKDDILKFYFNEIPYGQNAYGIEAAAQTYFNKHAHDLDLAEAAYLAALPQAPSFYAPNGPNRDKLDTRKNYVLEQMLQQGYITASQLNSAKAEKVAFSKTRDAGNFKVTAHFVQYVQSLLAEKYGEQTLEKGGLNVVTTLDWNMQQLAQKAIQDRIQRNEKDHRASNAALVAIDPKTGQILAMVGSRDYFDDAHDGQVNVVLRDRQPGSSIKPYIYATAFKQGLTPATMLVDVQTDFGSYAGKEYIPSNYDGKDHGIVSIRKALAGSLNVPAVKTLALVGVANAIDIAKNMGITSNISADRCGLALVLGGCEVSLLDHTSAMGVFANMGTRHDPTPILSITNSKGQVLEEYQDSLGQQVIDPQIAYEIDSILTDNESRAFIFGANSPLILPDRVVAAKTGTTQAWRDGWTLGFTPSLVAGVWVGNNDNSPMRTGADGVVVAAPIWNQFMRGALKNTSPEQFLEPPGIQHVFVDAISGKLPTEYTPQTKSEIFPSFALPADFDNVHIGVKINKLNGKKTTDATPPELIENKVYTVIRSEQPNKPNWEVPVEAWAVTNGYAYPPTELDDGSTSPQPGQNQIQFITPANDQEIQTLPFVAQINPGNAQVQSVALNLEGQDVGSKSSPPYSFSVKASKTGWQTLTAKMTLTNGDLVQTSIRINISAAPANSSKNLKP